MRYQLITAYADCTTKTEQVEDVSAALSAAAIYVKDRDCITVKLYDNVGEEFILNYWRDYPSR